MEGNKKIINSSTEDFKFACLSGCWLCKLHLMETKVQSKRATYVAEFELYEHFMVLADSRYENEQLQRHRFATEDCSTFYGLYVLICKINAYWH